MADDAPAALSPLSFIQTPPDSPQDATELHAPDFIDNALHLRLKTLDERVFEVEAASSMSVADFRAKVALATAVPVSRQRLIYRGKLLKDGVALATYDLQDGHTVHLVAKPPASTSGTTQTDAQLREVNGPAWNLANLRSALRRTAATTTASQPLPMLREILGDVAEAPHETTEGMGHSSFNGFGHVIGSPVVDLEPMTQGILTMRTVLSTAASEQRGHSEQQQEEIIGENVQIEHQLQSPTPTQRSPRQFFVGQWLDVKDTVNQWLESTVMAIAEGKVLIHYHGWPTRWDEWIDVDSDRIAAFRTRTLHTQNPQQMSPIPTTRVPSAPRVGDNDVRQLVINVRSLMREMMPHIDRLAALCEEDLRRDPTQAVDSVPTAATTLGARQSEVSEVAHLVAPLFDRFGRLLMDSAGHFDPLLRPELQGSLQRQRERFTATSRRGVGESTQLQDAAVSASTEVQNNAVLIRDLIATTPNTANEATQSRRNIDVHIHAIVAPASLSTFAQLARGNNDTSNSDGVTRRRIQTPSTPPIERSFATLNEVRTIEDESDHSRVPLLGAYRPRSLSESSQQRAVARDLDNFLSNDFFGSSFGHDNDENDSDDESNHSNAMQEGRSTYRPPSPSRQMVSPRTPQPENSLEFSSSSNSLEFSSSSIGVIPEVAAAEARLRAAQQTSSRRSDDVHESDNGRTSTASAESSTSSSSGFPTFLEVMRRTLSGVRNFVHSEGSSSSPIYASNRVELEPGFPLPFEPNSSLSISSPSSLSTPVSPVVHFSSGNSPSNLSDSSIDEELDLDQVD